jgi:hypothetical protein
MAYGKSAQTERAACLTFMRTGRPPWEGAGEQYAPPKILPETRDGLGAGDF